METGKSTKQRFEEALTSAITTWATNNPEAIAQLSSFDAATEEGKLGLVLHILNELPGNDIGLLTDIMFEDKAEPELMNLPHRFGRKLIGHILKVKVDHDEKAFWSAVSRTQPAGVYDALYAHRPELNFH